MKKPEPSKKQTESSKRKDVSYEPKGIPVPKSGIFPIQEMEYKIAAHLRKSLNLDLGKKE